MKHPTISSSVSTRLSKRTLFRGCLIAFFGIMILLATGSLLPIDFLQPWGGSLFLVGIGLITFGLLPYRRLSKLQLNPNKLVLINNDQAIYFQSGKKLFTFSLESIEKIKYLSRPNFYGVAIWLKKPPLQPVIIHQCPKIVKKMRRQGREIDHADLFFSYFNEYGFNELLEWNCARCLLNSTLNDVM